jgi:outer membrane biosynthesis protein TonB
MDPTRLRDDPDQPQGLRDLLDHSVRDVGTRDEIARTALKLAPLIGIGALGALTTTSAAKASVWAGKGWWLASAVAGTVVVAGVAGVTSTPAPNGISEPTAVVQQAAPVERAVQPSPQPEQVQAPTPPAAAESPPPRPALKDPARTAPTPPPTVAEPPVAVEPAPVTTPAPARPSEAQLLSSAQSSLASDPARALKLTAEHRQLFPTGAFTQEREVIEIDALYRLGRKVEADRRATQFVARNPGSSYARRVKEMMKR